MCVFINVYNFTKSAYCERLCVCVCRHIGNFRSCQVNSKTEAAVALGDLAQHNDQSKADNRSVKKHLNGVFVYYLFCCFI